MQYKVNLGRFFDPQELLLEYGGQIDLSKETVDEKGETQKSFDE